MPLSSKQEDIHMRQVALSLVKHINWKTKKLEGKNAYVRIAEELNTFWGCHLVMWVPSGENTSKIFLIQSTVILSRACRLYWAVAIAVRFLSLNFMQR